MRISALVGALLGWFALLLQLYLMLVQSPAGAMAMVGTVITYFSFFTILTNLLVALVFTATVFSSGTGRRPATGWGQFCRPTVQAGAAAYIAIVGIIYRLLLRQLWDPHGMQRVADVILHDVIPVGYVLYWLLFAPRTELRWKDAVGWLGLPRRLRGLRAGAWRGERALALSLYGCECAGLRRRPGACRGLFAGLSGNGLAGSGGGPADAWALARLRQTDG